MASSTVSACVLASDSCNVYRVEISIMMLVDNNVTEFARVLLLPGIDTMPGVSHIRTRVQEAEQHPLTLPAELRGHQSSDCLEVGVEEGTRPQALFGVRAKEFGKEVCSQVWRRPAGADNLSQQNHALGLASTSWICVCKGHCWTAQATILDSIEHSASNPWQMQSIAA